MIGGAQGSQLSLAGGISMRHSASLDAMLNRVAVLVFFALILVSPLLFDLAGR